MGALALLTALSLLVAPWAAVNREVSARSALLLLPDTFVDFTGRTAEVSMPGGLVVLTLSLAALLTIAGASLLSAPRRYGVWLAAGAVLLGVTGWGLAGFGEVVDEARFEAVLERVGATLEAPRETTDTEALAALLAQADDMTLEEVVAVAREGGVAIRRLPYEGAGPGLAAIFALAVGSLALLLGLRISSSASRVIDRILDRAAVPLTSILLALLAAAVVILALQPTPLGRDVAIEGWRTVLAGRLDTLWFAYQTLFADSLGTISGFMASLTFATPLIFTGLAVAFGFRAGMFNIGAPGQMVLGAVFAMLVGLYMPGPRWIVLPVAVLAAMVGGGLWGAIPGWLKARFGAHEVINTILMNFIAASLLLFILSSNPIFAASALRIIAAVAVFAGLAIVVSLIAPARRFLGRAPRLSFAVAGVLLLGVIVVAGMPRPGDGPVNVTMPFKVPGSEPKSYPLNETARFKQVPAMLGIDLAASPGTNVVPINYGIPIAAVAAVLALLALPRVSPGLRRPVPRLLAALAAASIAYLIAAAAGLARLPTAIPPTNLNTAFLLAIATAVLMHYLLWRTKWGYELRAVGVSPKAAEYGGANVARNMIMAMAISGAFAGLTATHYVLGGALEEYSLRQSLPINDGFDGIAVALLGGNTPGGVVLAAFLFGVLKNGGSVLNITFSDLTRDVVNMILALVVLFIAARGFLPERLANPLRRRAVEAHQEATEGHGAERQAKSRLSAAGEGD